MPSNMHNTFRTSAVSGGDGGGGAGNRVGEKKSFNTEKHEVGALRKNKGK